MSFEDDTNATGHYQGPLRFAPLNTIGLKTRCLLDAKGPHKIVMTHCDQRTAPCDADLYAGGPTRTTVTTDKQELMLKVVLTEAASE